MTFMQEIATIFICAAATVLTRFLPFLIFRSGKTPRYIQYLGKALPSAIFAMLVVYCLKDTKLLSASFGLPELIAGSLVIGLHLWRRNMLLSIAAGTIAYMAMMQITF